jgi:hypothetical protein
MKEMREYRTGESTKLKNVTLRLSIPEYDRLRTYVDNEERSIAWFLRKLVLNALDNEETSA